MHAPVLLLLLRVTLQHSSTGACKLRAGTGPRPRGNRRYCLSISIAVAAARCVAGMCACGGSALPCRLLRHLLPPLEARIDFHIQETRAAHNSDEKLKALMKTAQKGLPTEKGAHLQFLEAVTELEDGTDRWVAHVSRHLRKVGEQCLPSGPYMRSLNYPWAKEPWYPPWDTGDRLPLSREHSC